MIIWFTGLSGSGKSTISNKLKEILEKESFSVFRLDGDDFRKKEKTENAFTKEAILKNNYRMISYCQEIKDDYDFIIVSAISPFQETRDKARETFGNKYFEIFLDCPKEVLIKRDPKKLYAKVLSGEIKNLIGFSEQNPYERPKNPDLVIDTSKETSEKTLEKIINLIKTEK